MNPSGRPRRWRSSEGHTGRRDIASGARLPRGQRPGACTQAPRAGTGRSRAWPGRMAAGSAKGTRSGDTGDERAREVGPPHSTGEALEQGPRGCDAAGGGGGGKGAAQGQLGRANQVPDAEPERPATGARPGTPGSGSRSEGEVHDALAPRLPCGPSPAGLLRPEAARRAGGGPGDVAALRRGSGSEPDGSVVAAATRSVPKPGR